MMVFRKFLFTFLLGVAATYLSGQGNTLDGAGYERHNEIHWGAVPQADRYEVWKKGPGETAYSSLTTTQKLEWLDWTGIESGGTRQSSYFIRALNVPGTILQTSDTLELQQSVMTDEQFLDMTQAYTFRYFYDYGHPVSGMARERLNSGDIVTTGGTGFGIMALLVGIHRGYITREQGVDRLLQIVSFLQYADRFHGAFPHWMNGKTGDVYPFSQYDNGGDLVETAFLMEGLLCARAFFDQDAEKENVLRDVITSLWEDVEWDFYTRNDSGVLYWHWSPNYGWQMNFQIRGYNEALIIYLLAIASPTHPVDASYYHDGWAGGSYVNGNTWYGNKLLVGPNLGGPLFFGHYSFMGFDPRGWKDEYANYFIQNRNHTLINRSWCKLNPFHYDGYSENCWGLTASDDPWGYQAHAPGSPADNGTLTPAAGIPSMPYTPQESIDLLKNLYRTYGAQLWGEYGFYDAFNPDQNWFADSYLAIDQGPIINMIENYRSGLLWNLFMSNPEIIPALEEIGFVPDSTVAIHEPSLPEANWNVYPTITLGSVFVTISDALPDHTYTISLVDIQGRQLTSPVSVSPGAVQQLEIKAPGFMKGWKWVVLTDDRGKSYARPVLVP